MPGRHPLCNETLTAYGWNKQCDNKGKPRINTGYSNRVSPMGKWCNFGWNGWHQIKNKGYT